MTMRTPLFNARVTQDHSGHKRKLNVELTPLNRMANSVLRFRRSGLVPGANGTMEVTINVTEEHDDQLIDGACSQPDSYTIPYSASEAVKKVVIRLVGDSNQTITRDVLVTEQA